MTVDELSRIANRLRLDVVETVHDAGDGHPGPCMSIADIMAVLFFDEMKLDPANPHWPERDRFVLSKGHACPILYAALARKGYFPLEELKGLRSLNSFLQGHPDMNKIPGVDTVSGSLGNGVAIGLGMATGCRMQGIEKCLCHCRRWGRAGGHHLGSCHGRCKVQGRQPHRFCRSEQPSVRRQGHRTQQPVSRCR